jgi:hypothetical protein
MNRVTSNLPYRLSSVADPSISAYKTGIPQSPSKLRHINYRCAEFNLIGHSFSGDGLTAVIQL